MGNFLFSSENNSNVSSMSFKKRHKEFVKYFDALKTLTDEAEGLLEKLSGLDYIFLDRIVEERKALVSCVGDSKEKVLDDWVYKSMYFGECFKSGNRKAVKEVDKQLKVIIERKDKLSKRVNSENFKHTYKQVKEYKTPDNDSRGMIAQAVHLAARSAILAEKSMYDKLVAEYEALLERKKRLETLAILFEDSSDDYIGKMINVVDECFSYLTVSRDTLLDILQVFQSQEEDSRLLRNIDEREPIVHDILASVNGVK